MGRGRQKQAVHDPGFLHGPRRVLSSDSALAREEAALRRQKENEQFVLKSHRRSIFASYWNEIDEALSRLPEDHRQVIKGLNGIGGVVQRSQKYMSAQMIQTEKWVQNIEAEAIKKLQRDEQLPAEVKEVLEPLTI